MGKLTRRKFIARAGSGVAALQATSAFRGASAPAGPARKFYAVLSLGRIGFNGTFEQSVELAHKYGFEGIDPDADLSDADLKRLLDDLASKNLKFGAAGLPVDFRKDEATFSEGLKKLPDAAKALQRAGVGRVSTWVLPSSNDLTYLQNFRAHACRLRECARVLADHGQRLGLEYVAPRTFWRGERQPFVHTLSEMKELLVAIGTDNLGIQLDTEAWTPEAEWTTVGALCINSSPCHIAVTVSAGRTVIARTGSEQIPAQGGGLIFFAVGKLLGSIKS